MAPKALNIRGKYRTGFVKLEESDNIRRWVFCIHRLR
jgi:hypothetical protein